MAVIDEASIRELATIKGDRAPITSCYLDVDGRRVVRYQDLEHEVDLLLRQARDRADGEPSVEIDLRRIERYVRDGIDRSRTRGLAIFACSQQDIWEVIELPVPVNPQISVNDAPAVGQLEVVVQRNEPIGVLAVDRQRARVLVAALGHIRAREELFDALPRQEDARGEKDRGGDHPQRVEGTVQQHIRNAAQAAFTMWQRHRFGHLLLAARGDLAGDVEASLHPYLVDRLGGRLDLPVTASDGEVLAAVTEAEIELDRRRQAEAVEKLREAVASGRRGVAGLPAVLRALSEHRVSHLLVSHGFAAPGWRCDGCGTHAAVGRRCKRCRTEMIELEDVVEEAVQAALSQSCLVEVCTENADLDVMGRIGALLRY